MHHDRLQTFIKEFSESLIVFPDLTYPFFPLNVSNLFIYIICPFLKASHFTGWGIYYFSIYYIRYILLLGIFNVKYTTTVLTIISTSKYRVQLCKEG